jgi:hypothetical protein
VELKGFWSDHINFVYWFDSYLNFQRPKELRRKLNTNHNQDSSLCELVGRNQALNGAHPRSRPVFVSERHTKLVLVSIHRKLTLPQESIEFAV